MTLESTPNHFSSSNTPFSSPESVKCEKGEESGDKRARQLSTGEETLEREGEVVWVDYRKISMREGTFCDGGNDSISGRSGRCFRCEREEEPQTD